MSSSWACLSPLQRSLKPTTCLPLTTPLQLAHERTHTKLHPHTLAQQSTRGERPVWRSLAHLSLYQAVSPSLQRRCRFEECATVGRMNLHDELGIYLFIFQPTAPRHITFQKVISIPGAAPDSIIRERATSLMMIVAPDLLHIGTEKKKKKLRFVSLLKYVWDQCS